VKHTLLDIACRHRCHLRLGLCCCHRRCVVHFILAGLKDEVKREIFPLLFVDVVVVDSSFISANGVENGKKPKREAAGAKCILQ